MKRWLIVVFMSLTLIGCGTKFIYDNLDWIAIEYVEDFVELNDRQQNLISESIQSAAVWHRSSEIPAYLSQLDELLLLSPATLNQQQFELQEQKLREHTQRLLDHFFPAIVDIVAKMSDEQVEQLMNTVRVRHIEFKQQYLDTTELELRIRYQKRIEETLTEWIGPLTVQQQSLVELWAQDLRVTTPFWFEYQTQIRVELGKMFASRAQRDQLEVSLRNILYHPQQYYSLPLEIRTKHNSEISRRYIVEIINLMTAKQTETLREELNDWRDIAYQLTLIPK
ncbi:hypothetical protein H2O73_15380 [Vibrio sp. 404]|uniref:Lipoprotein n=1 Tax=Vibrio marinisediminis TaxID=2758441 RepID=A0A7W2FT61_9VIBR|nr:DUF6279 family lipoprotein [Vibrio marinisediminis]MBA5763745.1 hypothetical protein [Vibrio marinisediminis]